MTRKTTIPLYHGDDFERMAELRREISIAERNLAAAEFEAERGGVPRRIGDESPTVAVEQAKAVLEDAQAAFTAFVDEAADRAEMWVLHPIGHEEFRELLKAHPPRKVTEADDEGKEHEVTHVDDAPFNVNTETYPKALLTFVDPEDEDIRTVAEPFESVGVLQKRIKRLSAGEFDSMWIAAHTLNQGFVADPKASPSYGITRRSDET